MEEVLEAPVRCTSTQCGCGYRIPDEDWVGHGRINSGCLLRLLGCQGSLTLPRESRSLDSLATTGAGRVEYFRQERNCLKRRVTKKGLELSRELTNFLWASGHL